MSAPRLVAIGSLAAIVAALSAGQGARAREGPAGGGAATTGTQTLQPAFANTIVSTYPDGRKAELWLDPDGTYTAEGRKRDRSNGRWTLKRSEICLRQSHPITIPLSYCTAVPTGGVGASWRARSVFGDRLRVRLEAGRRGAGG